MTDDIVARLRVLASEFPTVNGWMDNEWKNAADEIERLRAERDEARQEVCGLLVACHTDPDDDKPDPNLKHIHAGIRGWDCFKEDKEDTDD